MPDINRQAWVFKAILKNVNETCGQIQQWLLAQGLTDHQFALQILSREALNNAVIHGSKSDPAKSVSCAIWTDSRSIFLEVQDEGPGFNWNENVNAGPDSETTEHGRGINIYHLYADQVEFNENGNRVLLSRAIERVKAIL